MPKVGNAALQLQVRDATCTLCKLGSAALSESDVCITGQGKYPNPDYAIVTKFPASENTRAQLSLLLEEYGLASENILWLSALKCRVWDVDASKTDLKACRQYLSKELEVARPPFILTLGNEALFSVLGKSGITKYRSREYDLSYEGGNAAVVPTLAPQAVERNPGQRSGFLADISTFAALVKGESRDVDSDRPPIVHVKNQSDLKTVAYTLSQADGFSYDIESRSESKSWLESDPSSVIVSLSLTVWKKYKGTQRSQVWIYAIPLCHPESPFKNMWQRVLALLAKYLKRPRKTVAHNGKYDCRWLRQHGVYFDQTFDTMIAAHLLDENRPKGLKPLTYILFGIPDWSISTKDLWEIPINDVLHYNALDTWYTYKCYLRLKRDLLKQPKLKRLFVHMLMPASNDFVDIERRGIWCDRERLYSRWDECRKKLSELESELESYLPDETPHDINWNPSNFLRWFLFDYLELPVYARGKTKDDGSPGNPSVAEAVMTRLAEEHQVVKLLLERVEWNKFDSSFFAAYDAIIDSNDRIHTTFKLTGTSTGRTSSGKEDTDKITSKSQIRGMNAQQVPRNSFIRGLFGAAPSYTFVQADQSQVELRIAAFLAREMNMIRMYRQGEDIHMAMAIRMTGKPRSQILKEERKKAKAVNFGFLYGMQWRKFIATAWEKYQLIVTEQESKAFRTAFFDQFPDLLKWHRHQRLMVRKYKRVESPIGRVRHLPDIDSPDEAVRAEAERQAINSPVQSFGSDITLQSTIQIQRRFRELDLDAHVIGTVHDAINLEVKTELLPQVLPIIKSEMETPPLRKLYGLNFDVPLVADISIGKYWGDAIELTEDQVNDFDMELVTW